MDMTEFISTAYTLVIHGGTVSDPASVTNTHLAFLERLAARGAQALESGSSALDVIVAMIAAMEDSGLFDAGKGSYLNRDGYAETDAAVMEGHTGRTGAVAVMRSLKNPVRAARLVMDETAHVLFAGSSGEEVLINLGAETVPDPSRYFVPVDDEKPITEGTVGAVALDRYGHLAAGTSTGGTMGKLPGRISDSCIIGAGTFANHRYALSATGKGEHFIRRCATHSIAINAELKDITLQSAVDHMVHDLIGGMDHASGAVIAISSTGEIAISSNVYGVLHASCTDSRQATSDVQVPTIYSGRRK